MEHRTEYDLKAIGRNLKHLRESRHLTVEQVREYLCLGSVQAVYKYESGTGYPQADTLLALMELAAAGYGGGGKTAAGRFAAEKRAGGFAGTGRRTGGAGILPARGQRQAPRAL